MRLKMLLAWGAFFLGERYAASNKLDRAIVQFLSSAANALPRSKLKQLAHRRAADVLEQTGRMEEAISHVRITVETAPSGDITAWKRLATLCNAVGRREEAIDAWRRVLAVGSSDDFEATAQLADLLYQSNRKADALPHLRVLALCGSPRGSAATRRRLAQTLEELGDLEGAVKEWQSLLATTDDLDVHDALAQLLVKLGRKGEAITHLRALAEASVNDLSSWRRLARQLDEIGDCDNAISAWRHVVKTSLIDDQEPHIRLADLLCRTARNAEAAPHLRFLAEAAPTQIDTWQRLGRVLAETDDTKAELEVWRHVLAVDPNNPNAHLRLSQIFQRLGCKTEAIPHLRFLAETAPNDAGLWRQLARALAEVGDSEAEIAAWRRTLSIDAEDLYAHARLSQVLSELGRKVEAIPHLHFVASAIPNQAKHWRRLARALGELGDAEQEVVAWQRALSIDNEDYETHSRLAQLLKTLQRSAEAIPHLRFVADADPSQPKPWRRLAQALVDSGDPNAAIAAWRRVLAIDVGDSEAHGRLAELLPMLGRNTEAIQHLLFVAEASPEQVKLWKRLAWALADTGDATAEMMAWRRVLSIFQEDTQAHARLGQILVTLGRNDEAALHLRFVNEAIPHHANPQTEFGIRYYSFLLAHIADLVTFASLRSEPAPSPKERKLDCLRGALQTEWSSRIKLVVRAGPEQGLSAEMIGHAVRHAMEHTDPNQPDDQVLPEEGSISPLNVPVDVYSIGDPLDQSLEKFVETAQDNIGVLYVSYETYTSARSVFRALNARIVPGTIIVFDKLLNYYGFENNSFLALYEFLLERGLDFKWVSGYGRIIDLTTYVINHASLPTKIREWLSFGFEQEFAIRIVAGNPLIPQCGSIDAKLSKLAEALLELRPLDANSNQKRVPS